MWHQIEGWFKRVVRRNAFESDLAEELEFHLRARADMLEQRGWSKEDALRRARVELGNPVKITQDVRDSLFGAWMAPAMHDIHYGLRMLCKRPGVAIAGVMSLAIGMGVCSFFFAQFNAMVLRPLPAARAPQALVATTQSFSYPVFERFRELEIADDAAAYVGPVPFNVAFENRSALESNGVRTFGHLVSPNYFSVLGVAPAAGRFFGVESESVGSAATVVISDSLWKHWLSADPGAVGRTLRINGYLATVVGIAPPGFRGVFPVNPADVFLPATSGATIVPELRSDTLQDPEAEMFHVVLRLASGVPPSGAAAALDAVARSGNGDRGGNVADATHREGRQVTLLNAGRVGRLTADQLWMVVGLNGLLVALVLSLACANLAGLLVARGRDREREMAVRAAIGAGRMRLIRQMLTETVVLATAGGIAGVFFSYWLMQVAESVSTAARVTPFEMNLGLDTTVGFFVAVLTLLAGVGVGLVPAFAATRPGIINVLKGGWFEPLRGYRRFGFRNLFVGYQVAVSVMLLLVVGYLVIGFQRFSGIETGLETRDVVMFEIDPVRDGYTEAQADVMFTDIPEGLRVSPVVAAASVAERAPLGEVFGSASGPGGFRMSTTAGAEPRVWETVARQRIGVGYFETLGVPVVQGREFADRDHQGQQPVPPEAETPTPVVLNQMAARRLFGGQVAIGQPLRGEDDETYAVVGIVPDSRASFLNADPMPTAFLPLPDPRFRQGATGSATVLVRGLRGMDPSDAVREELARFYPDLTMFNTRTLNEHLERFQRMISFNTGQFGGLGIFGLLLASVGLASVTAHAVERRRKEIGIRLAIGAHRLQVFRLVLKEGLVLVAVGTLLGCVGAIWLARLLSSLLVDFARVFAVSAGDPVLLVGVPALLVSITFLFCYFPGRRAMRVDPADTLRTE